MATYNGEKYLAQQLDSFFSQTVNNFTIHILDDQSTDNTWQILTQYKNLYPDQITITRSEKNSGEAKHTFLELVSNVKDDYLMLSDQDDIWLPDKIEITLEKMKELEAENPKGTPLLVHTDLTVADKDLNIINPSFRKATTRRYGRTAENQVLTLNNCSGCTIMYNRAMAELLKNKPPFCEVHDWWLQIVAAFMGKIGHIDKPTVLYRQHGNNSIGAKDTRTLSYKIKQLRNNAHIKKRIRSTYPQAQSLLELYHDKLTDHQRHLLKTFISIPKMGKFKRWQIIYRNNFFMDSLARNIAFFMFV